MMAAVGCERGSQVKTKGFALAAASLATAFVLGGGPAAFAAYVPQDNTGVNVNLPVSLPNLGTGSLTFGLGQGVQSLVGTTGLNLPYDYVVVGVNNQPIAFVDPFALYRD